MGYSTMFELKVHKGDLDISEILSQITEDDFEGLYYAVDEDGETADSVKWYDHENDMRRLSKMFPDIVFLLEGEGESNDDMWKKYFKNGKMQSCYAFITFEAFDEKKLVE